jgi:hypothetical protein
MQVDYTAYLDSLLIRFEEPVSKLLKDIVVRTLCVIEARSINYGELFVIMLEFE